MARKKNRSAFRPAPDLASSTGVVTEEAVAKVTTGISRPAPAAERPSPKAQSGESFLTTPLGQFLKRTFRVFASLQLAISLLTIFTLSLILATLLESRYNASIAQELIYHTWWFVLLLSLLGTNILCAALKKMDPSKLAEFRWPWKGYQTGFLVTHVGLITLVLGGLMTNLGGMEGQMQMIDSKNPGLHERFGTSNSTSTIHLTGQHRLDVFRVKLKERESEFVRGIYGMFLAEHKIPAHHQQLAEEYFAHIQLCLDIDRGQTPTPADSKVLSQHWKISFRPGSFVWHENDQFKEQVPEYIRVLKKLADPFPGLSRNLGPVTLRLNNYWPSTEVAESFSGKSSEHNFKPVNLSRLGMDPPQEVDSAVAGVLLVNEKPYEFRIRKGQRSVWVHTGGEDLYLIRYRADTYPTDFTVTLKRAKEVKDPGSQRSAAFESEIVVSRKENGKDVHTEHRIYMNHTLDHGGFRFFQANYRALGVLDGQKVSLSGIQVARDPGLLMKYAGSLIVVLGIVIMFYMKAYFFKPRGKRTLEEEAKANQFAPTPT